MQPLQPQQNPSEVRQAFADVAEEWLIRPRNPQADAVVLDAVQRRQEHQNGASRAHTTPTDDGPHAGPSPAVVCAARLVKLQGQQHSEAWLLPPDRPALVGRSGKKTPSLDVDLWPDEGVSRRHALIWFDGEGWRIEDLRSRNGTFLGDSNIRGQRAMRLALGTTMRLGRTILMLTALGPEGESRAEPSAASGSQDNAAVTQAD